MSSSVQIRTETYEAIDELAKLLGKSKVEIVDLSVMYFFLKVNHEKAMKFEGYRKKIAEIRLWLDALKEEKVTKK